MKKRLYKTALCLAIVLPNELYGKASSDKPNLLIFIADDLGWEEVGAYGHKVVKTPNIDWLAQNGLRFDNFFLTASSSSPSRSSILTGMYPSSTGAKNLHDIMPAQVTLFSEGLRDSGYYTMLVGKNHGTNSPELQERFDYVKSTGKPWKMAEVWKESLRQRPKHQPFFMFAASHDPHRPYKQEDYDEFYDPSEVIVPPYLPDSREMREDIADYYNEVTRFDRHIGEVLDYLRQEEELENTVIIVMTDNGRPFSQCKTRVNVQGIKSPFIVYYPSMIRKGSVTQSLASAVDIAPTLLEMGGVRRSPGSQGISLLPILKDAEAEVREYAFAEHNWHTFKAYERAVITKDFIYMKNWLSHLSNPAVGDAMHTPAYARMLEAFEKGKLAAVYQDCFIAPRSVEELYAIKKDIHCLKNLVGKRTMKKELTRLRFALKLWQESVGDVFPGEDQLKPDANDGRFFRPLNR